MIPQPAFGDSNRKRILLQDVREAGPISTLWLTDVFEGDLGPISRDFALHPAFVKQLAGIAGFGKPPGSEVFLEAALDALPVGGDTARLARQIILLAWTHPDFGAQHATTNGAVRQACERIVGLVSKSLDTPQDRKAWRSARSALSRAQDEAGGDETVSGLVLSMAWDIDDAPGAALDVIISWSGLVMATAYENDPDTLSASEQKLHMASLSTFHHEVMSDLGDIQPGDGAAYAKYQVMLADKWASNAELGALNARTVAQRKRLAMKEQEWRKSLQDDAIELARAVPVLTSAQD